MKIIDKIIFKLIYLYLVTVFFNGILTKIFIKTNFFWFKKLLPELIMFSIIILISYKGLLYKKLKMNTILLFLFYLLIKFIYSINDVNNLEQVFIIFRDLILPFILLLVLDQVTLYLSNKELEKLEKLFFITSIVGFILCIVQINKGWEWTSKFYRGYEYYAIDPVINIKISHIKGVLRPPTITGNFVTFSLINAIFAFYFYNFSKKNKLVKVFICIINCIISTSRTGIVAILIYLALETLKTKKYINKIIFLISMLGLIVYFYYTTNLLDYSSVIDRFKLAWLPIINTINVKIFLVGENMFKLGSALYFVDNTNINMLSYAVVDNAWIYLFMNIGLIGISIFVIVYKKICKFSIHVNFIMISLFIAGLFTNIFQGRSIFYIMFILIYIFKYSEYNSNYYYKIEKS